MADQFSNEYTNAYVSKPVVKLNPAEKDGKIRRLSGNITLSAEIGTTDSIFMAKLPANAVIVGARMVAPGGASGTLALGWGAGENEAADADGIFAAIPGNAAADLTFDLSSSTAAKNKRFSEEVDIILSASVISGGWSGDLVELELSYIIE